MAYLGNSSTSQSFTPAVDYFTADGATSSFTLSRPVASVAQVEVVVNNVVQNPSDAFTVNGNTLTFTSVPAVGGTNNVYVRYTSLITDTIKPSDGTVVATTIASGAVTAAKMASGAAVANIGARALGGSQLPAGTVLQVLGTTKTDQFTSTPGAWTFVDVPGLSLTITPSSPSSKVLVKTDMFFSGGKPGSYTAVWRVVRDSTPIGVGTTGITPAGINGYPGAYDDYFSAHANATHLDSPNTTSSVTYKVQVAMDNAGTTVYVNRSAQRNWGGSSNFTLMEIAG